MALVSTERFIQIAKEIHGNKYDYSQSIYTGARNAIKIICPQHGLYEQRAGDHANGKNCPKCQPPKIKKDFFEKAREIHGDRFDYSLVNYKRSFEQVIIICPFHGQFKITPSAHLSGSGGCQDCFKEKRWFHRSLRSSSKHKELAFMAQRIIYFVKVEKDYASFWKVGITSTSVEQRFGVDFFCLTEIHAWKLRQENFAYWIEREVLRQFNDYAFIKKDIPYLLAKAGDTECFDMTLPAKKVIAFIEKKVEKYNSQPHSLEMRECS